MARRTKEGKTQMEFLVKSYLLRANNDPHEAYNEFIKCHLMSSRRLPDYIKGLKDFVDVAKAVEYQAFVERAHRNLEAGTWRERESEEDKATRAQLEGDIQLATHSLNQKNKKEES